MAFIWLAGRNFWVWLLVFIVFFEAPMFAIEPSQIHPLPKNAVHTFLRRLWMYCIHSHTWCWRSLDGRGCSSWRRRTSGQINHSGTRRCCCLCANGYVVVTWLTISLSPNCSTFKEHRNRFRGSIPQAYVAGRDCTTNRVVVPVCQAGNRFLGSLKGVQIRALLYKELGAARTGILEQSMEARNWV